MFVRFMWHVAVTAIMVVVLVGLQVHQQIIPLYIMLLYLLFTQTEVVRQTDTILNLVRKISWRSRL